MLKEQGCKPSILELINMTTIKHLKIEIELFTGCNMFMDKLDIKMSIFQGDRS